MLIILFFLFLRFVLDLLENKVSGSRRRHFRELEVDAILQVAESGLFLRFAHRFPLARRLTVHAAADNQHSRQDFVLLTPKTLLSNVFCFFFFQHPFNFETRCTVDSLRKPASQQS